VDAGAGNIGRGGAYCTDAIANWKTGRVCVYFTQVCGDTQKSRNRKQDWTNAIRPFFTPSDQATEGQKNPAL